MIKKNHKNRQTMSKFIIIFWLLSAMGVLLILPAETKVAQYRQQQQMSIIDQSGSKAEKRSALDVAKLELGKPVGILKIPSLSLKLPIYNGTSEKVLLNGIGITEGTGDIEGGNGKNPLLSGHSGLIKNSLFDNLTSVKKGEKFYIQIEKEQHEYKIDRIEEIEKDELQNNFATYLKPNDHEDRVTLMTCTPKGVNSHRFLVYGKRVSFNKEDLDNQHKADEESPLSHIIKDVSFLASMIIGSFYIYKQKNI
ncbi:TPA: class C sortase [Enterococcus faecium]|nr:class C sortase [Enterococcus faecium]